MMSNDKSEWQRCRISIQRIVKHCTFVREIQKHPPAKSCEEEKEMKVKASEDHHSWSDGHGEHGMGFPGASAASAGGGREDGDQS